MPFDASIVWNPPLDPVSDSVQAGDWLCLNASGSAFVIATTANLAAAGGIAAGISRGTAAPGTAALVQSGGFVDTSLTGLGAGAAGYVEISSAGRSVRAATISNQTVGECDAFGNIWIQRGRVIGGTTLGGVNLGTISAARSWILAGDGTNLRSRKGQKNVLDYGAVGDGTTDDTAAIQAALDDLSGGEDLFFPKVAGGYKITSTLRLWGGTQYLGLNAIQNRLIFEGGWGYGTLADSARLIVYINDWTGSAEIDYVGSGSGSGTFTANAATDEITFASGITGQYAKVRFTTTGTLPAGLSLATDYWLIEVSEGVCKVAASLANAIAGTAAPISDAGSGTHTLTVQSTGTTQQMMRLKNPTGITAATNCVGMPIRVWNTSDNDNVQQSTVCKLKQVGADLYLWVFNNQAGASAPDYGLSGSAGAGTVRFRIERPTVDIRAREVAVRGGIYIMAGGYRCGSLFTVSESPAPAVASSTATTTSAVTFRDCVFSCNSQTSGVRGQIRIADDILPTSDSSLSRYIVNGDGVPVPWSPYQVDYTRIDDCTFLGGFFGSKTNAILGFGRAGQSERNTVRGCNFGGVWNGFTAPRSTLGGTNLCHADFYDCDLGHFTDSFVDISSTAFDLTISRCKGEFGSGRLLNDRSGSFNRVVRVEGCEFTPYATGTALNAGGHPTRHLIETNVAGVVYLSNNSVYYGGDASKYRLVHLNHSQGATASAAICRVVAIANRLFGTTDHQGRPGFVDARRRGPHKFAGTETLDVKIDGGATTTVTFSQANFNAALAQLSPSYTIDMNEVRNIEVAFLLMHFVGRSNMQGYASEDDHILRLFCNDTAGSSIQVTGGTANTQLDFNTAAIGSRSAVTQIQTDTNGLIEASVPSSSDEVELVHLGNAYSSIAGTWTNTDSFIKTYQGGASLSALPALRLESVRGLSRPGSAIPPRNFWKAITHAGGTGATFTWTFDTAEDDTNYTVFALPVSETGAPAAGARTVTAVTKNTGSAVFTATDPGGAASVTWHVELRR